MNNLLAFISFVLICGVIAGGNWKTLADWSSAELVGYNVYTLVVLLVGGRFVLRALNGRKKTEVTTKQP
jgi:hypothetical protein